MSQDHRAVAATSGRTLTPEQEAIVAHDPSTTLVVEAAAGTGKTSVLEEHARRWRKRGLYLAFNKAIAEEAKSRFPPNITAKTSHGFAYGVLGVQQYKNRLMTKIRRNHIRDAGIIMHNLYLPQDRMMKALQDALVNFMICEGPDLLPEHCGFDGLPKQTVREALPIIAREVGRFLDFQNSGLPFTHDIYLKHLELHGTLSGDYDYLLVDEAQDWNPVLLSLVKKTKLPAIVVGDQYQSIYAFRGAVNAMSTFEAPRLPLTQSWRFGESVARLANHILAHSSEPPKHTIIGRPGQETLIERYGGKVGGRTMVIARTNARLFEGLINSSGKSFHIAGGFDVLASQLMSAWHLSRGNRWEVRDPLVSQFETWEEFTQEGEEGDPDARKLTKLVEEHGDSIPEIINELRKHNKARPRDAALRLSTAHKAKGLEEDVIVLMDDFETPAELREKVVDGKSTQIEYDQEINLLYVAATRAKTKLVLAGNLYDAFAEALQPEPHAG